MPGSGNEEGLKVCLCFSCQDLAPVCVSLEKKRPLQNVCICCLLPTKPSRVTSPRRGVRLVHAGAGGGMVRKAEAREVMWYNSTVPYSGLFNKY